MDHKQVFIISWGSLVRVAVVAAFAALLYQISNVLFIVVLSVIFSSALDGPVSYLETKRIPRVWSTLMIYLVALGFIALVVYTVVPIAAFELTKVLDSFKVVGGAPQFFDTKVFENLRGVVNANLEQWSGTLASGSASLISVLAPIFGGVMFFVSTVVFTFYLAVGKNGVDNFLSAVLPLAYESYVTNVFHRVRTKIGRWLQAQMALSAIMGFLVGLGLFFLGVRYSLTLGILAGLFEMVPVVGPVFIGVVAIIVALSDSANLALYTLLFFVILQQLESNFLVPVVMRRAVGLHPLLVFISLIIGGNLLGFVGLLVAVPIAVTIQEVVEDWTEKKNKKTGLF
jgi:predicted PurR-regulated permease PerM